MNGGLEIPPNERGIVRVFALDNQLATEIAHTGVFDGLCQALGVQQLNSDDVQIIRMDTIADMGLPAFLGEGYGIDPVALGPHVQTLEALTGGIAIIRSAAFGGRKERLKPDVQARLIATLPEPQTSWSATPAQTSGVSRRTSPRAARSQARRIGLSLFTVMMALILLVVYWVAT